MGAMCRTSAARHGVDISGSAQDERGIATFIFSLVGGIERSFVDSFG